MKSPRRQALRLAIASIVFLLVGGLLNPTAVSDWANGQPLGWRRDVALEIAEPIESVSDRFGIDEPRRAAADLLDRSPTVTTLPPRTRPPVTSTPSPPPTSTPGDPGVVSPSLTTTLPPPATTVAARLATVDDPLRILTLGDSMMVDLQAGLDRLLVSQGVGVIDGHGSFFLGLTSAQTGYLEESLNPEWARHVATGRPDVVVMLLGASDFENWAPAGEPLISGSPQWRAWIERRADDVMAILTAGGAHVYWMSTPLMESDRFESVPVINEIWRELETTWPGWVTVLDSMDSLGDVDGQYQQFLSDPDGGITQLRADDGVHFFDVGADRLAVQIGRELVADGWLSADVIEG